METVFKITEDTNKILNWCKAVRELEDGLYNDLFTVKDSGTGEKVELNQWNFVFEAFVTIKDNLLEMLSSNIEDNLFWPGAVEGDAI